MGQAPLKADPPPCVTFVLLRTGVRSLTKVSLRRPLHLFVVASFLTAFLT